MTLAAGKKFQVSQMKGAERRDKMSWKRTFPATQEDERVERERKIAGGASRRNEDSKDIGRLILRTAGRCKVQLSKGIVSTRTSPEQQVESGESMSGLPSMQELKEIRSRSEGS
jgi:hypothetical protein